MGPSKGILLFGSLFLGSPIFVNPPKWGGSGCEESLVVAGGVGVRGLGFGVQGSGFRVQGLGFRV